MSRRDQQRLERALARRMRAVRAWPIDEDQATIATEFEVEDVVCTRLPLGSAQAVHAVPSWLLTCDGPAASAPPPPLSLALASLHPSREFANSHLEARSAVSVAEEAQTTRVWLERCTWRLANYNVDLPPIDFVEVRACCASRGDDDTDADEPLETLATRLHFSTPLFQSMRMPGEFTLQHRRRHDEQASQIAWSAAELEQSYLDDRAAVRVVNEEEFMRTTEVTAFADEVTSDLATLGPVTHAVLQLFSRVLHRYGLPVTLQTSSFFHALSGFSFLSHLLLQSADVHSLLLQTFFEPKHEMQVLAQLEARLLEAMWPTLDLASTELRVSPHCAAVSSPPPLDITSCSSMADEDETVAPSSSRFARMADDALSFVDDTPPQSTAEVAAVSAEPAALPPAVCGISNLLQLVSAFFYPNEWSLEFILATPPPAPSARNVKSSKPTRGKGKRR